MFKKQIINLFIVLNLLSFPVFAVEQTDPLANVYQVTDSLLRGAQPDAKGFAALKEIGVKTIINLRDNYSDVEMIKGLGFQYINIPINPWELNDKDVVTFLKVVTDPNNQPVFVHCQHGLDRTGTAVAIYRVYVQNWPYTEALKELPKISFNKMWEDLKIYLKNIDHKKLESQIKERGDIKIEIVK
ncbi:MAG: dual specificity protein phosphatase family protein [bacterium]|nr:dual specificity protein phosphatase family protein [bacterium]